MSLLLNHSFKLIESYAEATAANRDDLAELRRLASLEVQRARKELASAEDRWFLATQDRTLAANALFESLSQFDRALRNYWYQIGAPYDADMEKSLIRGYRQLVEDSEDVMSDLALFRGRGRPIEGAEAYEAHVRQAREILADDAIREEANRLIPTPEKLDALAKAHLHSTGR